MRAYELYLRNKDSTSNVCQTTKPVKKIFINKVKVPIDNTIIDQYDSERIGIFFRRSLARRREYCRHNMDCIEIPSSPLQNSARVGISSIIEFSINTR